MEKKKREAKVKESSGQQLLRNPDIQPTEAVIEEALGEANNAYVKFVRILASHDIQIEWRYYTDGKAWLAKGLYKWTGVRGGQKKTTVFWLSIWDGFFKVTIYIPEKSREDVLCLFLHDEARQMAEEARLMGERLSYFPLVFDLRSDELFEAILSLVDFKKRIH